ncbi:MAG: Ig-like domain-containing protein [Thermodesulfobacteriota bacterium]
MIHPPTVDHGAAVQIAPNCGNCHAASPVVDSADPKTHFSCAQCHDVNGTLIGSAAGRGASNTCADCHGTAFLTIHPATVDHSGLVTVAAACSGCHSATPLYDANDGYTHSGCGQCHDGDGGLIGSASGHAGGGDCTVCHGAAGHDSAVVHNYRSIDYGTGAQCDVCHTSDAAVLGAPGTGTLASQSDIDALHSRVTGNACDLCHRYNAATQANPENLPLEATVENAIAGGKAGLADASCAVCHDYNVSGHGTIDHLAQGRVTGTASCLGCHDRNSVATEGYYLGTIHNSSGNGCGTCHLNPAGGGALKEPWETVSPAGGSCAVCHAAIAADYASHNTAQAHTGITATSGASITTNCVGCHGGAIIAVVHNATASPDSPCDKCHENISGTLRSGANGDASQGAGDCLFCHAAYFDGHSHGASHAIAVAPATDLGQANGQPCSNCHAVGDWTAIRTLHDRLASGHGTTNACATCHDASRDINPEFPQGVTVQNVIANASGTVHCLDCHLDKEAPAQHFVHSNYGYVSTTPTCVTGNCHAGASVETVAQTHLGLCIHCHTDPATGVYTLKAGSLAEGHGHTEPGFGAPNTCITCHSSDFPAIHTPLTPAHNVGAVSGCADCHGPLGGWADIEALHDVATNGAGPCATCHASPRGEVAAAINDGNADNCGECHLPHAPTHNVSADAGCDLCHGPLTGWAEIEAVHQPATGGSACVLCHTSGRAEVIAAIGDQNADTCAECHPVGHDLLGNHAAIGVTADCTICHGAMADMNDIDALHDVATNGAGSCATCHKATRETGIGTGITIADVIRTPGAKECVTCHVEKASGHPGGGGHNTIKHSPQCLVCHSGANIITDIHKDTCTHCHDPGPPTLKAGITAGDCMHCHGTHHGPDHNNLTGTASCNVCHADSVYDEIVAIHATDCAMCHKSSDPAVIAAIDAGNGVDYPDTGGTAVDCQSCHSYDHHSNAHTQKGDCGYCHADPRPGWEDVFNTPLPSPLPYQMACRECHVEASGTGLVVYKNSYYTNAYNPNNATLTFPGGTASMTVAGAATVAKTPVHTIASTSGEKINVYNFGACLACHQVRQLHHARPKAGEYPTPDPFNVASFPYDTLRNAPGRSIFNEFRNESRMPYEWLRRQTKSTENRDRGRNFLRNVSRGSQPWNWGEVNHLTVSIPCIDPVNDPEGLCAPGGSLAVPYFSNIATPGPFPEKLHFQRAVWNEAGNNELTLHVTNDYLQNATLTVSYGTAVTDAPMTWNAAVHRWELTVDSLIYVDTVTVTSTIAGGGVTVRSHFVSDMSRDIVISSVSHPHVKLNGVECAACHSENNVTEHVTNRGFSCSTCHSSSDPNVLAKIAYGQAGNDVFCTDCHGPQSEEIHRNHHDGVVSFDDLGAQCDRCHEQNPARDHVDDRGWTCDTCHADPRFAAVIASGKAGNPVHCSDCHNAANASTDVPPKPATMAIVTDHWLPPDHSALGHVLIEHPCDECHDPTGTADVVTDIHGNKCGLCHLAPPVLNTGIPATGGTCRTCHTDISHHHKGQQAQAGDCGYCHVPRGIDMQQAPPQMACKSCHINSNSYQLEVKRFDLTRATGQRPTELGVGLTHIIPNVRSDGQPIQIYDYRACFACHSGLDTNFPTAPVVRPFHGFLGNAAKGSGTPAFDGAYINDAASNPNVGNMLPRVALYYHPGLGTFNRFGAYFGARTGSNNNQRYRTGTYYNNAAAQNVDTLMTAYSMGRANSGITFPGGELVNWRGQNGSTFATAASGYGLRLPSAAYNVFGAADGPYSNVPYFTQTLPAPGPYGERISVTKADWDPIVKRLTIWAINDGLGAVQVYADAIPMAWSESKGRWEYVVSQPTYLPQVTLTSDDGGYRIAHVANTKDNVVVVSADWDKNSTGAELHVIAENESGTVMWVDFGASTNLPMTNDGGHSWSLTTAASVKPAQVRVHSNNYGDVTVPVTDVTLYWPPQASGNATDAGSYWDRGRNPDRLRVTVNMGADPRTPTLRLNGSGTWVDYPCSPRTTPGQFRCEVNSDGIFSAGYDPWVVIYTGATPGAGTVVRYRVNDWAVSQNPLTPVANAAPSAFDDSYTVPWNSSGNSFAVLANDNDPDNDPLSVLSVGVPSNGGIATTDGTTVSYSPAAGFTGVETFAYTVSDGQAAAMATITVVVDNGIDDPPAFGSSSYTMAVASAGSAYTGQSIAGYAIDPELDPVTYSKLGGPAWLTVAADGTLGGTPATGDIGANVFTVQATSSGGSATATLNITVQAAPTAVTVLNAWPAAPQLTGTTGNMSGTFTIGAGSNRLLLVAVSCYDSAGGSGQSFAATYGGKPLTQAFVENSNRRSTWIGYLKEADIGSRSGDSVTVTITGAHTGVSAFIGSYASVNQTTPIAAAGGRYINNTNNVAVNASALSVGAGGYAVYNWSGTSGVTRTSDNEGYTEHADATSGGVNVGVASKSFTTAGSTNPTVTWSANIRSSVSLIVLNKP